MPSSTINCVAGATQNVELPALAPHKGSGPALLSSGNELLDSIAVEVSVIVGRAHTTVGHLMSLKQSDMLRIDRGVDQPIDIVVNGIVVARGELVVMDDNFGVRVTEVAAAISA